MKRSLIVLLLFATSSAFGADASTSQTFVDGDSVNGAKLNNIVGNLTILPGFISDKSSATPITTDWIVFYQVSSAGLRKTQFSSIGSLIFASPTFTGTLTSSQATVLSGIISPTQITSDQNNYAPTGLSTATTLRLSTDAARAITGLSASSAVTGQIYILHNVGSFNITLSDENASSTAANRFALVSNLVLQPDQVTLIQYDGTSSRWRAVGNRTSLKSYLQFIGPHKVDGTGAVMQASTTATYNGQAKFSNSTDQATNFCEYRFVVPTDIDTSVDLKARIKFQLSNTDTGKHRYVLSVADVADSAAYAGSLGNAVNMDFAGDASGANGDLESVGQTTLTGWKSALTAGHLMVIRWARDGDDGTNDTSTVDSYSGSLEIEYSPTGQ